MQRWSADVRASFVLATSRTVLAGALFLAGNACKVSRSLGSDPTDVIVPSRDAGEVLDGSLPDDVAPCWDRLRSQLFRRALCACRDAALGGGAFLVDAFDSSEGPYTSPGRADIRAAVGVNRELETSGAVKVTGDLTVSSLDGLSLSGAAEVLGDLRVRGPLRCTGFVSIQGDAWLEGGYTVAGTLTISGDRIMPPAASTSSPGTVWVGGSDRREPIAIEPPCVCDGADVPDLAAAIRRARTDNDNAAHGFDAASLRDIGGLEAVSLAGRVYSTGLSVNGQLAQLSLVVDEKVSLFIDGDLVVEGGLAVQLGAAGELDLFVAGRVTLSGWSRVGNAEHPARVRVYVASEDLIRITGTSEIGANLYAPRANVVLQGQHALYGSVFAQDFTAKQTTAIHYDAAVLRSGDACAPAGP